MNYGEFFGYPTCCIEAFGFKIPFFTRSQNVKSANEMMNIHTDTGTGTGYVPCEKCATRIINGESDKIVNEINSRRLSKLNFPYEDQDDDKLFEQFEKLNF